MFRFLILCTALTAAFLAVFAQQPKAAALEGLDPVLLTEGKEVSGNASITLERGRFLYQFSSEETRTRFRQSPERYEIQLGGACARMGPPVTGQPDVYHVYKNRIYIFGSGDCYKHFAENPAKYLESEQPQQIWKPTPETLARGQALLKKMLAGMGGPEQWVAVHAYTEARLSPSPRGETTNAIYFRAPDSFRTETSAGQNRYGILISGAGTFRLYQDEGIPIAESDAKFLRAQWQRELPALLLRVNQAELISLAENQIMVNDQGIVTTLQLDPRTFRVASISWRGRGKDGFGERQSAFSDYRAVGDLQLPFRAEGSFDGVAIPDTVSWTVQSYQINPEGIDARFQKPAKIRVQ